MRVFVTGATGFVGSALVQVLVQAGHQVTGLSRSAEKDAALKALGANAVRGELSLGSGWQQTASDHDALVHAAVDYTTDTAALDRSALDTLLAAARTGRVRSLIYTSGVWVLGNCPQGAGEDASVAEPFAGVAWRPAHERRVLEAGRDALHTAVIRPGLVYGGHGSLFGPLFQSAASEGAAKFIGSGKNRWPTVHREDLARLYLRVLEAAGSGIFHGVDGSALTVEAIARAASEAAGAGGKTHALSLEEGRKLMGPVADALCMDQVVRAPRAQALGWTASRPDFAHAAKEAFAEWKKASGR